MGFNPAYWLAISVAFLVGFMSVTDPVGKVACYWGAIAFLAVFVLDLLRRLLELELQPPLKRREEPMAVRTRDFADGTREYRIRMRADASTYSLVDCEEMNGCLIKGEVKLRSK